MIQCHVISCTRKELTPSVILTKLAHVKHTMYILNLNTSFHRTYAVFHRGRYTYRFLLRPTNFGRIQLAYMIDDPAAILFVKDLMTGRWGQLNYLLFGRCLLNAVWTRWECGKFLVDPKISIRFFSERKCKQKFGSKFDSWNGVVKCVLLGMFFCFRSFLCCRVQDNLLKEYCK